MKSLKTLLTAAVLGLAVLPALSCAPPPAGGGDPGGPDGRRRGGNPGQQVAASDTAVTLTAEQRTKVTAIVTKASEARAALAPEDRRGPKGQEMTTATNAEIRAALTAPQQTKFDAYVAEQASGRGPGGPGGGQR